MNQIAFLVFSIFESFATFTCAVILEKVLKPRCISFCIPNHTIIMAFYGLSLEEKGCTKTDKTTVFYAIHLSPKVTFFSVSLLISTKVKKRESLGVNLVLAWFYFNHRCEFVCYSLHRLGIHTSDYAQNFGFNRFTSPYYEYDNDLIWVKKMKRRFLFS